MAFTISNGRLISYTAEEGITDIVIPDGVTHITDRAFSGCSQLTSVMIPDSVSMIDFCAFEKCIALTSVQIPEKVKIESQAFKGCKNLAEVTIPESVNYIGGEAFSGTAFIKKLLKENGCAVVNGILLEIPKKITSFTIPDNIREIGQEAFKGCKALTSITIPENISSIGYKAFAGCTNLTEVMFAGTVESISSSAFIKTPWLEKQGDFVILSNVYLYQYQGSQEDVEIPEGVTVIGNSVFYNCKKMRSVTIPDSVQCIETRAFHGCDRLGEVNIASIEAWKNIRFIGSESNPLAFASKLMQNGELVMEGMQLRYKLHDYYRNIRNEWIAQVRENMN